MPARMGLKEVYCHEIRRSQGRKLGEKIEILGRHPFFTGERLLDAFSSCCPGEYVRARVELSSTQLKTTTKVELIARYSPDAWALSRSLTLSSKPELRT